MVTPKSLIPVHGQKDDVGFGVFFLPLVADWKTDNLIFDPRNLNLYNFHFYHLYSMGCE